MSEIRLPAPLEHQEPLLNSPARYKLGRCGRRWGKSRAGMIASVVGHGVDQAWRGAMHGVPILWLAPDYPQARAIWNEELRPRFAGVPQMQISEVERIIRFPNGGSLEIRSAEAIDGVRGRKYGGVIFDECAYFDLEYCWTAVIRPALADLQGWALFLSTPNAGKDGNANARTPSFFNILCEKYRHNELGPEWEEFHASTRDNLKIPRAEVEAMYAEYPPDSPQVAQELDAKLIKGGAGIAFPEWDDELHTVNYDPPRTWRWAGSLDWGLSHTGCFALAAFGPEEQTHFRWEWKFNGAIKPKIPPKRFGYELGQKLKKFQRPEYIIYDPEINAIADGRGGSFEKTVAELIQDGLNAALGAMTVPLVGAKKGKGSRRARKLVMHEYLRYERGPDGKVSQWARPKVTFDRRDCPYLISSIPALPLDEKDLEDVDTKADDHGYDTVTYLLTSHTPLVERSVEPMDEDAHPGFSNKKRRKWDQEEEPVSAGRWSRYTEGEGGDDW